MLTPDRPTVGRSLAALGLLAATLGATPSLIAAGPGCGACCGGGTEAETAKATTTTASTAASTAVSATVVGAVSTDTVAADPKGRVIEVDPTARPLAFGGPKVVVANRLGGNVTVIDARADRVLGTFDLAPAANPAEPMYVNYTRANDAIWIGDRANNRVLAYANNTGRLLAEVPTGAGIFHQWADPLGDQLWVACDIDKTATVIDVNTFSVIATVPMPADLSMEGDRPHDVIVDAADSFAVVSILRSSGPDYLVRFDTTTFAETGRFEVGEDPHLSWSRANNLVYSPNQGTSEVYIFDPAAMNFEPLEVLENIPGAHGAGMSLDGERLYVSNISGGGADALWFIDTSMNMVVGEPADTPVATPHNIAVSPAGNKLWVTHSGSTATAVTVFEMTPMNPMPMFVAQLEADLNPFGLALVP